MAEKKQRKKKEPPKFKKGDRVIILSGIRALGDGTYEEGRQTGTVEAVPKISGCAYTVRFDKGYFLNGKDCPQSLSEEFLELEDAAEHRRRFGRWAGPDGTEPPLVKAAKGWN